MREVCDKHGALLILDEVMSGMGRSGTLHAWQQEGIVPDIQTIGKGLGGGYAPVSGVLINKRVVEALDKGTGAFMHGQTYQGHPIGCVVAFTVQREIRERNLLANVREMGALLERLLRERLEDHPHVGNIRGKGLFWGVSADDTECERRFGANWLVD
jgi:adenosylmethionine-8-amino-7-oxononanoate aminotransferase